MHRDIYLDNGAKTPPDPDILETMIRQDIECLGNPGSGHTMGRSAMAMLEEARERMAAAFGGRPQEIIFTGGGTEANGLAILGLAGDTPVDIANSAVEHSSITEGARYLETRFQWTVNTMPVDEYGAVTSGRLAATLVPQTRLVAFMMVNNEIGTINDIQRLTQTMPAQSPWPECLSMRSKASEKSPFRCVDGVLLLLR